MNILIKQTFAFSLARQLTLARVNEQLYQTESKKKNNINLRSLEHSVATQRTQFLLTVTGFYDNQTTTILIICSDYVMLSYVVLENTSECICTFAKFARFLSNTTADWPPTDCSTMLQPTQLRVSVHLPIFKEVVRVSQCFVTYL